MRLVLLALLAALVGCDQLGIESTTAVAARRDAEGKAIGGGCRHAARSLEQCYEQNKRADKAAVFAGWREMNDYMRDNKLEAQPASPPPAAEAAEVAEVAVADAAEAADSTVDKPANAKAGKPAKPPKP